MSVLKRSKNVVRIEGADYSEKGAGFRKKVQIGRISGKSMKRCTFRRFPEKKVHVPRRPRQQPVPKIEICAFLITEMTTHPLEGTKKTPDRLTGGSQFSCRFLIVRFIERYLRLRYLTIFRPIFHWLWTVCLF